MKLLSFFVFTIAKKFENSEVNSKDGSTENT